MSFWVQALELVKLITKNCSLLIRFQWLLIQKLKTHWLKLKTKPNY